MNVTQTEHTPGEQSGRPAAGIAARPDFAGREDEAIRLLDGGMARLHEVQQAKSELKGLTASGLRAALEFRRRAQLRRRQMGGEPA